jgi:hypothetical protein
MDRQASQFSNEYVCNFRRDFACAANLIYGIYGRFCSRSLSHIRNVSLRVALMSIVFVVLCLSATPAQAAGPLCNVPGDYSTIQAALNDTNCQTIALGLGQYTGNLTITRSVTIMGFGSPYTTIAASAPGSSVIQVSLPDPASLVNVSLQGVTITGGHAVFGGGINNVGATLMLTGVSVTGNRADNSGGGIYNAAGGKLSLSQSSVSGNSAGQGGGGIYNTAALSPSLFDHIPSADEIDNTLFKIATTFPDLFAADTSFIDQFQIIPFQLFTEFKSAIVTKLDPAGFHDSAASPITLFTSYALFTVVHLDQSQVNGNIVDGVTSPVHFGLGAGILNELGVVAITNHSGVDSNQATASGVSAGGGVLNFGLTGLYNSSINSNSVLPASQSNGIGGAALGGGVFNLLGRLDVGSPNAPTEVANISTNTLQSTFASLGGGIMSLFGSTYIYSGHVDANTIPVASNHGYVLGAGISNYSVTVPVVSEITFTPEVHIFDSTVSNNAIGSTTVAARGGAIHNLALIEIARTTMSGNTATSTVSDAAGAGIWTGTGSITISKSTISNNSAFSGLLPPIANYAQGGGIYAEGTDLSIAQSTLTYNSVTSQSAGTLKSYARGAAIFFTPVTQAEISSNQASAPYPVLTIDATTIVNNSSSALCTSCAGNPADLEGGGFFAVPVTVSVTAPGGITSTVPITTVNLYGSILARNSGGSCDIAPTTGQMNLSDDPSCAATTVTDPQLTDFGDYGGPTLTYVPLTSSPARNAGFPVGDPHCFPDDQRGQLHSGTSPCDIGSVQGPSFLVSGVTSQGPAATTIGTTGSLSATLNEDLDPTTATTANVIVLSKFQGKLNATVNYNAASPTISIQPVSPLIVGDTITTVLTTGLQAQSGQHLVTYQKQFTVVGTPFCVSNSFQQITTNLPNVEYGSIQWADFDGDGKLDAVITGVVSFTFDTNFPYGPIYTYVTDVYHNDGNGQFTPLHAGITPVGFGDAVWGDFDGDGKPDLLVMGRQQAQYLLPADNGNPNDSYITTPGTGFAAIYRNNGDGTFSLFQQFDGFENGKAAWVDLNNDGKLDVVLTGVTYAGSFQGNAANQPTASKIYLNNGNTFTAAGSLPILNGAAIGIADYDSDGRMDLSVLGEATQSIPITGGTYFDVNPLTNIFRNVSSGFTPLFPNTGGPLPQLRLGSMDWADVDGDGKPDVLLSGEYLIQNSDQPPVPFTDVFKNNGDGTFTAMNAGLPAVNYSSVRFGDYDNDGHPDILLTGLTTAGFNQGTTTIFHNNGSGVFTQAASLPPGISYSYASWADIDNDGKLELSVVGTPKSGGQMLTQIFAPTSCRGADVSYTTPRDAVLTVPAPGLLANASSQNTITGVVVVTQPANGTLTSFPGDGSFIYMPQAGFSGTDSFTFNIHDAAGSSSQPATVTITVLTQSVSCFATFDGGTTVAQGIDGTIIQQAIDAAPVGATLKIAGYCAGTQLRAGQSQTAYLSKNLSLEGGFTAANWGTSDPVANPTTLDAVGSGHVVNVAAGVTATIQNLILTGGSSPKGGGVLNAGTTTLSNVTVTTNSANNGGGVANSGTLTLSGVILSANGAATGGGLWNSGSAAHASVLNSTLSANSAHGSGGAVYNEQSATVNITASTLVGNQAGGNGAALDNETSGNATILNSTLFGNSAGGSGGAGSATGSAMTTVKSSTTNGNSASRGGGFYVLGGSTSFVNTINVKNSNGDCAGPVISLGHNIDTDTTCNFHAAGDLGTDPLLQALASNGGPTQTELLALKSPAIDKGDNSQCPTTDQRGQPRPNGATCDIGAVEQTVPGISALNDSYAAAAGVLLNVSAASGVLANDFSRDNSALTAVSGTSTSNGTLTLNSNGSFTYQPNPGFVGTDSFTYSAKNDLGTSSPATVTILVTAVQACSATVDGVTVFTSADATALQSAINGALVGSTVKVAGTCAGVEGFNIWQEFTSAASTIYVSHSVTIQGGYVAGQWTATPDPVAHPTILDAQGNGRVAIIESAYTMPTVNGYESLPIATNVTLSGLTLQNGYAGTNPYGYSHGGGISVLGANVTVQNCIVKNNKTDGDGGGLYFATSVDPRNTTLPRNVALPVFYFRVYDANNYNNTKPGLQDGNFTKLESIDGGPFVQLSGSISEPFASANPGLYQIALSAAEVNGDVITLRFAAPGAMPMDIIFRTSSASEVANPYAITVSNSSFTGNTANGVDAQSSYQGGAGMYLQSTATGFPTTTALATVNIDHATISGNHTPFSGGGIYSDGATTTFTQGTIANNSANDAGGFGGSGNLTIQNSTITRNNGVDNSGAGSFSGSALLSNSTIASNTAGRVFGGLNGSIQIKNSIVGKNSIGDCNGVGSQGGNIDSDGTCKSQASDKTFADPGLLTLADNGGPTQTIALSPTSGAINAGLNCLTIDQRGQTRLNAPATCDSGAFELGPSVGAANDSYRVQKNTPLVVNAASGVLANDVATGAGLLSATKLTDPVHGALTLNADGSFTYTPTVGFTGPDTFTYAAAQGGLISNAAIVNISVVPLLTCLATPNNGTNTFTTVQAAIDAAPSGGTVKVAGICTSTATEPFGATTFTQIAFINKPLTLLGGFDGTNWNVTPNPIANQTVLDANHTAGVLTVTGTSVNMPVIIQNLIMTNGTSGAQSGVTLLGANVTISNFEISNNVALNTDGGGIQAAISLLVNGGTFTSLPMTLTLSNGAIINNQAVQNGSASIFGGAISMANSTLSLTNVTISGNLATSGAGAIFSPSGSVTLNNSTVVNNRVIAVSGTGGAFTGNVTINNTIVSGNTSATGNCTSAITSLGYNLDSDGSCGLGATADISHVDPSLAPIANNGGFSSTAALLPNSRAINAGNCSGGTVTIDQRGVARPQGAACDIGAYEFAAGGNGGTTIVPPGGSATTDPVGTGASPTSPLQVKVTSPNAGSISILVATNSTAPSGFSTLGWQAAITAPPASAAAPLQITFTLDASLILAGQSEKTVQVFDNGTQLPDCSIFNGTATPDPCVSARVIFSNGDVELDVLSSTASSSTWTFNTAFAAPIITLPSTAAIAEGSALVQAGSFTDPSSTSWTATVDYGDGLGPQPLTLTGKTFSLTHIYGIAGAYTAQVSITGVGGTSTASVSVLVNNLAPVVSAGGDVTLASTALFSRSGSFTDPGAETWTASVNYGDGTNFALPLNPDKSFALSHSYGKPGVYLVRVVVTDSLGASGTASLTVTISNTPPVVTASAPQTVMQGSSSALQVATFTDGGSLERHTASIDWGDSSIAAGIVIDGGNTGVVSGSHAYGTVGNYTATITVTDDSGASGSATLAIIVTNSAPSVLLPAHLSINEATALIASGSFIDVGLNKTWTATVDYGDGSGVAPLTLNADKSFALNHVYAQSGNYTATVIVKDSNGGQSSGISLIVVNDIAPTVTLGSGGSITVGSAFTASGSFTDPGAQTWTATVDYGDGSGAQALALNADKTFALNHTYSTAGSFTITVIVTDSGGASGTKTLVETVTGVAPTVTITDPLNSSTISGLVTVAASVSGTATINTVTFAVDGAQIGAALTSMPYVTTLDARTLSAGTHTISVTVNSSAGNSMASISVTVDNSPAPGDAIVDSNTKFSVQAVDNDANTLCPQCSFASIVDLIPGQTIEVRRQAGSNPPVAAELVLKQGSISGAIATAGSGSFTMQANATLLKNLTIQVVTDSSTVLEGFPSTGFAAQQKVVVRGFLYKGSTAGSAILVAKQVELLQ